MEMFFNIASFLTFGFIVFALSYLFVFWYMEKKDIKKINNRSFVLGVISYWIIFKCFLFYYVQKVFFDWEISLIPLFFIILIGLTIYVKIKESEMKLDNFVPNFLSMVFVLQMICVLGMGVSVYLRSIF